jgi:glycosyltransferase involved in cell wall biosynthesis
MQNNIILHLSNLWIRGGIPLFLLDFIKAFPEFRHVIAVRDDSRLDTALRDQILITGGEFYILPSKADISDEIYDSINPLVTIYHNRYPEDNTLYKKRSTIIWNHGINDTGCKGYENFTRVFVSDWVRKRTLGNLEPSRKVYTCPPCIDFHKYSAIKRTPRSHTVFGNMACRWNGGKFSPDVVSVASKHCADNTDNSKFIDIEKFREDLLPYYSSIDCLLYILNINDGLGRVILEAMASGIPVIALNHSGPKELLAKAGRNSGILIDSIDELPKAMSTISKNRSTYIPNINGQNFVHSCASIDYLRQTMMPAILSEGFGHSQ